MHRYLVLLGLSLVVACNNGGDDKDTSEGDTDTDTDADCDNGIVSTYPAADAEDVYYKDSLSVTFQQADDAATVTLADSAGTEVATTTEWTDATLAITPSDDLMPSTTYDLTVDYECGAPTVSFTTSDVGAEISDPSSLIDSVFLLDLASGNFVEPPGVGPLIQQQLTVDILIGVEDADSAEVLMLGALGAEGVSPVEQDLCEPTIDFPSADFTENPFFAVGPQTTTLSVQGFDITIDDLFVSGAFAPDASSIQGAVLKGSIDTRPIVPLIDPQGTDDTVCELVSTFGVACEACSDGTGDFCLSLEVNRIEALGTTIAGLDVRTEDDIANDSACN